MPQTLTLTGRYYRTIPIDAPGYEEETLELDADRTTFVGLHCWNIGCPDGPPVDRNFWVGMGFPATSAEAYRIMEQCIRPAMDASRRAGILVSHVTSDSIARRHPEAQEDVDLPGASAASQPPVVPGYAARIVARNHGADYATGSPYAHMDRAKIVRPEPGEPYVYQTGQFDRILRRRGIENLIYSGFATDMCLLRAAGGIEPMFGLGYRVYLMRDATIGVEMPDMFEERRVTEYAVRFFETHFGDTVGSEEYIARCDELAGPRNG